MLRFFTNSRPRGAPRGLRRLLLHPRRRPLGLEPLESRRMLSTVYVDLDAGGAADGTSWSDAYTDLQDALTAATPGDEVWVAEGTYTPSSSGDRTVSFNLKTDVDVYGGFDGSETTRLERDWTTHLTVLSGDLSGDDTTVGDNSENSYHVVHASAVTDATLDGFTITAGNADGNTASGTNRGGGMYNDSSSSPTLTNATFSGNAANRYGGGMYNEDSSSPTLTNSILWGNTARIDGAEIHVDPGCTTTVTYSIVEGGWAGEVNLDADPLFVDAAGGDLRLESGSPAVDAGSNAAVPLDAADLDGDGVTDEPTPLDLDMLPRLVGTTVDMGAYEVQTLDFGDAPSSYATLLADDGARHLSTGPTLGALRDWEGDGLPTATADGDDVDGSDDEDGLSNPAADLALTIGAQPTVNVIVTNTSGSAATLSGWIDYNGDGVFDNASERAQAAVADGYIGEIVTLTFPAVPAGFTGTTYARFRLSTDTAAADPTGVASDGEVEDYAATITSPSSGTVKAHQKISDTEGNFTGLLDNSDAFGDSVANVGDLEGDGVTDLAVGANLDGDGGARRRAVWMLSLAPEQDYGDAPLPYPTLRSVDLGARRV